MNRFFKITIVAVAVGLVLIASPWVLREFAGLQIKSNISTEATISDSCSYFVAGKVPGGCNPNHLFFEVYSNETSNVQGMEYWRKVYNFAHIFVPKKPWPSNIYTPCVVYEPKIELVDGQCEIVR